MTCERFFKFKFLVLIAGSALGVLNLTGCSTEQYKHDADREVYQIIDQKWHPELGTKANYRICDVPPSPNDINTDQLIPPTGVLTLVQAVALATAQNREYQGQKEQLYLAALDLTLHRHNFMPQLSSLLSGGYTLNDSQETIDMDGQVGVKQLLADGAQISANIAADWLRFLTGDPRTTLGSVLSATINQPLLRGRGRKIVQENLTQAERNALYQIRSFNRYRKTFVISIVTEYYRVLQQLDRVKNAKSNYESLLVSQQRIEAMADTGRLPRFQEGEAKQSTLGARNGYISAQELFQAQLDQIKIRLALPTDAEIELDPNELVALETVGISDPNFRLDQAIVIALDCRLDLANINDRVDDARRKVEIAAHNLGAELNLIGSAGVVSEERTKIANLQFHRGLYQVGLEAKLPLDRKAERNAYREALINLNGKQRNYEEEIDQVKLAVRQAYRDLKEAYTSYQIQTMSLKLAEKRVEMQLILLQEGRATTRNYLDAQDDLLRAQNDKTNALVKYTLSKLRFFRDTGILQVRPDGLWQERVEDIARLEDVDDASVKSSK